MFYRFLQPLCGCLLTMVATLGPAWADSEPPTAPGSFSAVAVSSSEIELSWDPSTDNRRISNYVLRRDGASIATTKKTTWTDRDLQADTEYLYEIVASDGTNLSATASFTLSTLPPGATDGTSTVSGNSGKGKGGKKNTSTEDPSTTDPSTADPGTGDPTDTGTADPGTGDPTDPGATDPGDPAGANPEPSAGVPDGYELVFSDDFDGSGDLDVTSTGRNWRFETMSDGLHRAGNTGINADGDAVADWDSVRGKRWSAWYDRYMDTNAYRENGALVMGGTYSGETDPTRPIDYIDDGVPTAYGTSKLYTSWIDTFSRKWVGPGGEHVVDPDSPAKSFKYGYLEARVSFAQMLTPGFRFSIWLMPASNDAAGQDLAVSNAYDTDGNNGVEIDLFEYEWISTDYENRIHLALLGGGAGSSTLTYDASQLGIDLHEGYHTLGLLWTADKLVWSINGVAVKEVTNVDLIPDVYSYLIMSREMNSGVKRPGTDNIDATDMVEEWPYIPRDPGLFAKNVWEFRDRISLDQALVDYVRIWQPQ